MRIAVGKFRIETAHREQFADAYVTTSGIAFDAVNPDRLGDDLADLHARVQRTVRILEDDLDLASQRQEILAFHLGDVDAVIEDFASGRLFEPQYAAAGCRLAAAALADQSQGLAATDREVDAVNRLHLADFAVNDDPLGDREMHLQSPNLEERLGVDRGNRHSGLLVEPDRRQILIQVMARADLPALHIGPGGDDPIPPQHRELVRLGIDHMLLEFTHQNTLLGGIRLVQHRLIQID